MFGKLFCMWKLSRMQCDPSLQDISNTCNHVDSRMRSRSKHVAGKFSPVFLKMRRRKQQLLLLLAVSVVLVMYPLLIVKNKLSLAARGEHYLELCFVVILKLNNKCI